MTVASEIKANRNIISKREPLFLRSVFYYCGVEVLFIFGNVAKIAAAQSGVLEGYIIVFSDSRD